MVACLGASCLLVEFYCEQCLPVDYYDVSALRTKLGEDFTGQCIYFH